MVTNSYSHSGCVCVCVRAQCIRMWIQRKHIKLRHISFFHYVFLFFGKILCIQWMNGDMAERTKDNIIKVIITKIQDWLWCLLAISIENHTNIMLTEIRFMIFFTFVLSVERRIYCNTMYRNIDTSAEDLYICWESSSLFYSISWMNYCPRR